MDFLTFTLTKDDDGRRLDRILRKLNPELSMSQLYKAVRSGLVKVDGKKVRPDFRSSQGSIITIADFLVKKSENSEKKACPLLENLIILRTNELLFINKPYDIPVQKSQKDSNALDEIVRSDYNFFHQKQKSLSFEPGPLHRLDRRTTGLIAFSQNLVGAQEFSFALKNHLFIKTYIALVQGKIEKNKIWHDEILKSQEKSSFYTVKVFESNNTEKKSNTQKKHAFTEVFPLGYGKFNEIPVTLTKFIIHTGRTHQIRSQSAFHGFPLLGDTAYGAKKIISEREFYLHSYSIEFKEKFSFELPQKITCPLDDEFKKIIEQTLIKLPCEL